MAKYKKRKRLHMGPLLLGAICILGITFMILSFTMGKNQTYAQGINYLQNQASLDSSSVQSKINELKQKQLGEAIKDGDTTIFSAFADSVILGDSRVVGFDVYGFLPSTQVFAAAGYTIRNISEFTDQIAAMQPSYIYFSYGVNDMGLKIGSELGDDGYTQVYKEQIDQLLAVSPNSKIIVNSIIECTPEIVKSEPNWGQTKKYNELIKKMCEDNGWTYVNNTPISKGGKADFYSYDGVHFDSTFYPIWAENMIRTALPQILGGVDEMKIPNSYKDPAKGSTELSSSSSDSDQDDESTPGDTKENSESSSDAEAAEENTTSTPSLAGSSASDEEDTPAEQ